MTNLRRCGGFTLIETLVAFVIAATSLALLFRIQANATTTLVLAEEYVHGTEIAQSLAEELPVTEDSALFRLTGTVERKYQWVVRSEPYDTGVAAADPDADLKRVTLRAITVELSWSSRDGPRRLELRTVKPFFARRPG